MPLVDQPFADTFTFSRARPAVYRNASGVKTTALVDQPRFDHTADGRALGLLIEGRPQFGQADKLRPVAGDWAVAGGTVLHHWVDPSGVEHRQAWFAPSDPRATVAGCLNRKGHHRLIAYVASYLAVQNLKVFWRRQSWDVGGILVAQTPDVALGVTPAVMILEG